MTIVAPSTKIDFKSQGVRVSQSTAQRTMIVLGVATGAAPLHSTVVATGTSPPTVTVTGYPTGNFTFKIDIETGGTLGVATFRWSVDGGVNWVQSGVVTAASVTLGATGVVANFSAGTYNADNEYDWTSNEIPLKKYRQPSALIADYPSGPGPECVAQILALQNAADVYFSPIPSSVPGSNSSVVKSNLSSPNVTLTGNPNDFYEGRVEILSTGALGTATFRYTLDGGDTYSETYVTSATYLIPGSGITLNFAAGTYTAGDRYTWQSTQPGFTTSDLGAVFDLLGRKRVRAKTVVVVALSQGTTDADKATAFATLATGVLTKLDALEAKNLFYHALLQAPDVSDKTVLTGITVNSDKISFCAGFCELTSVLDLRVSRRPWQWPVAGLIGRLDIGVDLSAPSDAGPVTGRVSKLYLDELDDTTLHDARYITPTTSDANPGQFFVKNPLTRAPLGDDAYLLQYALIKNSTREAVYDALKRVESSRVRTNSDGTIAEGAASEIEANVRAAVMTYVGSKNIQGVNFVVSRSNNLRGTGILEYDFQVIPYGYAKTIQGTGSFDFGVL